MSADFDPPSPPPTPPDAAFLEALPHGPTFRFIDKLTRLEPGRSGEAQYTIHGSEAFLAGHFPGAPMMPGVILIEAVAQLAGVVAQSDPALPPLHDLRLTAVRHAKILGTATPGETLEITATVEGRMGGLIQASGTIYCGNRQLVATQIVLSGIRPLSE